VEDIAEQAGVSKRTFFRYFNSKADVLWAEFDQEVAALRRLLAEAATDEPVTARVRSAVLAANHYGVEDVGEMRNRMQVIGANPLAQAGASQHYDAWAGTVADFAAARPQLQSDDLLPRAIGFSALAVCRAAFDRWIKREDADLIAYLDEALWAWRSGFVR
jgi:AcrR family transcriptional regulator